MASVSLIPASEVISHVVEAISEIVIAANNVLVKKESFKELATYLDRVVPILKEFNKNVVHHSKTLNEVTKILNREINAAKKLTLQYGKGSKFYLLMNCRGIKKTLEDTSREISRALSLLPLASLDLASGIAEEITNLCENMQRAEFKAAIAEEEILEKIETGINERNLDRSYANNLLVLIAEAVGIKPETSALKKEFEELKNEIENARTMKDRADVIQMDQIILLLGRADATSSPKEKELRYFTKRKSLGSQSLEPLQSFYCPITGDVMVDPVETSSGQTFERSAIAKWFEDGNVNCPLTRTTVNTSILRPNKTLRQSIEEWKDRNTLITVVSMKTKLVSEDKEEVLHCLEQLRELCEQREQHREWVVLEDYITTLVQLLDLKDRDVRNRALVILCILTKDSDDARERVADVNKAFELIVHSLGRRPDEGKLAVSLLLELSKNQVLQDYIGKVQGCILLLVTMSSSDDIRAAKDAEELLENLSFSDQNVILMSKANYFKHLLQRLYTGTEEVKRMMVSTLADLELTDHNKLLLLEGGVLTPLLHTLTNGDISMKIDAVKALRNLSSVSKNGLHMIKEGVAGPLFNLLFRHSTSSPTLRELVATTIKQLATSTISQVADEAPLVLLDSDDDVFRFFSLINLTGPGVQQNILQTFDALCRSPSATYFKTKLTECSAVQVLVQLCENDNLEVRANAVKLFSSLTEDGDESIIIVEHVNQKCLETLVRIIQSSTNDDETVSAMGIISNLPETSSITQWLLDANALHEIILVLEKNRQNNPTKVTLVENAVGALRRFADPTNVEWQRRAAEGGAIPLLVRLLEIGTGLTKKHAATSLARFSKSSFKLTRAIPKSKGFLCFSPPPEIICRVHGGVCSVDRSFCLVEAEAVIPLVSVLAETEFGSCEYALDALLTLIEAERLQNGSKVLEEANAIGVIIKLLGSSSPRLQEKVLRALERIFRLPEYKQKYGPSAHMPLVDLTQRGSSSIRSLSAQILAHLNVLHNQSSYF